MLNYPVHLKHQPYGLDDLFEQLAFFNALTFQSCSTDYVFSK